MMEYKSSLEGLVVCGGKPAFIEKLHVNRPNLGNREFFLNQMDEILQSYQFTNNGPFVCSLEEKLADYLGVEHCILTNNGTTAMAVLVQALNLKGEVIIPSFNFISTAHTLMTYGIKPSFCDINQVSWNIDPDHCETLINKQTSAIIGTHLWGRSCDIDQLEEIADRHNVELIFDAAHAFGCSHRGELIGRFGHAEVFSFHATKVFHTFEGGAITTNDDVLAERLRKIQNFGFVGYDEVALVGTNAKMPEFSAAMGITNLLSIEDFYQKNKSTFLKYKECIEDVHGLSLLEYNTNERNNYQYIVLKVDATLTQISRDEIIDILHKENIIARKYFYPGNHKMEPYHTVYPEIDIELPITNLIADQVLLLPGGLGVTTDQVIQICAILDLIVKNGKRISSIIKNDK